jgi:hypothetical protein
VAVLSDILQQIFSEYDVLVIENRALHEFQEQHRDAEYVQWKLEEVGSSVLLSFLTPLEEMGARFYGLPEMRGRILLLDSSTQVQSLRTKLLRQLLQFQSTY